MSIPTFMGGQFVVIIRTMNGFAIGPSADARADQCVAFETWDALTYYLSANFGAPPAP